MSDKKAIKDAEFFKEDRMANDCDCKHARYCNIENPDECNVKEEYRHFHQDRIMNYTKEQIAEMQGRKDNTLKP